MHTQDVIAPERAKYDAVWREPKYKEYSPGLSCVDAFLKIMKPKPDETLIDIGCGAGVAGLKFEEHGLRVSYLDLSIAGLDQKVRLNAFTKAPIWSDRWWRHRRWDYGYCADVLEHIPTEYTMLSIARIMECCHFAWLQICNDMDLMGSLIGQPLHLTVQPFVWWRDRLATLGNLRDARDLCGSSLFILERRR